MTEGEFILLSFDLADFFEEGVLPKTRKIYIGTLDQSGTRIIRRLGGQVLRKCRL